MKKISLVTNERDIFVILDFFATVDRNKLKRLFFKFTKF